MSGQEINDNNLNKQNEQQQQDDYEDEQSYDSQLDDQQNQLNKKIKKKQKISTLNTQQNEDQNNLSNVNDNQSFQNNINNDQKNNNNQSNVNNNESQRSNKNDNQNNNNNESFGNIQQSQLNTNQSQLNNNKTQLNTNQSQISNLNNNQSQQNNSQSQVNNSVQKKVRDPNEPVNANDLIESYEELRQLNLDLNKQKTQNQSQRDTLKLINEKLNQMLEKQKPQKVDKYQQEEQEDVFYKEIQNATNQLGQHKKEYKKLQSADSYDVTIDKIIDYQAQIQDNKQEKLQLQDQIKKMEKLFKENQKQLQKVTSSDDYPKQINQLASEVKTLREKYALNDRQMQEKENNFKKQEDYKNNLQQKYQEVCQKAQWEPQLDYNKVKEDHLKNQNQNVVEKKPQKWMGMKQFINKDDFNQDLKKLDENQDINSISSKQYDELLQKYKRLLHSVKAYDKIGKTDIDTHEQKKNDIQFENRDILNKIKEKEKELDLISVKYDQIKKLVKSNALTPLDYNTQGKPTPTSIQKVYQESEKIMQKACLEFKKRETKRDCIGGIFSEDVSSFDDCYMLDSSISHRIKQLQIFHDSHNLLYGIQVTYEMENGDTLLGGMNIDFLLNTPYQTSTLQMEENDQIKSVQCYALDSIEFIKIETSQGQILEVGSFNLRDKPKEISLQIDYSYQPITFFGGLDCKHGQQIMSLVYLGVEMKNPFMPVTKAKGLQAQQMHQQVESQMHKQKLVQLNRIETIKKKYTQYSRIELDTVLEEDKGQGRRVQTSKNKKDRSQNNQRNVSQSAKKLIKINNNSSNSRSQLPSNNQRVNANNNAKIK